MAESGVTFQWKFSYKAAAVSDDNLLKNGVTLYLVNEESKSTVKANADGTINAKGSAFTDSQWTIVIPKSIVPETAITGHGQENPVLSLQNVATGKFLAMSDGAICLAEAAGEPTKFMVHQKDNKRNRKEYQLIHHKDVENAVGFHGDGSVEEAGKVLAQTRAGSFFLCLVSDCGARFQAEGVLPTPGPSEEAKSAKSAIGEAAAAAAGN